MPLSLNPVLPEVEGYSSTPGAALAALESPGDQRIAVLAFVPGGEQPEWGTAQRELFGEFGLDPDAATQAYAAPTAPSRTTVIPLTGRPADLLIFAGAGSGSSSDLRLAAAAAVRAARSPGLVVLADAGSPELTGAALEGVLLAAYVAPTWTGTAPEQDGATPQPVPETQPGVQRVLVGGDPDASIVRLAVETVRATLLARNLAVAPSNVKNPAWMAAHAKEIGADTGLRVKVWDERALRREGFGGIVAVGQGSHTPPRLVQLTYAPRGADARPIVLVGKGITFDTGGLNVKPSAGMLAMKTDMTGSAIVLAVLAACRELGVSRRVVGLLPLAENAMGGGSYRPSDVITQYGGTTVEIGNTDAEGRLVLADALAYAVANLDPVAVVDIATLTGHARIALADAAAPAYGTDSALVAGIIEGFAAAGEPLWEMPLVDDYRAALDSDVADISHIGPLGGANAGSILAALFLREFVGQVPWAHLDIAGTGRSDSDTGILAKGATGYGARGLLRWLIKE